MEKFYSGYVKHWCLGANVKNSIGCAMALKMNFGIFPCNVYDETTVNNINNHEKTNFNFIVTNYREDIIDNLKSRIENFLIQNNYV